MSERQERTNRKTNQQAEEQKNKQTNYKKTYKRTQELRTKNGSRKIIRMQNYGRRTTRSTKKHEGNDKEMEKGKNRDENDKRTYEQ